MPGVREQTGKETTPLPIPSIPLCFLLASPVNVCAMIWSMPSIQSWALLSPLRSYTPPERRATCFREHPISPGNCLQYSQFVVVINCIVCWKPLSLELLQGLFFIPRASQKWDYSGCLHRWLQSSRWRAGHWLPKRPCFYTFSGRGVYFFKLC